MHAPFCEHRKCTVKNHAHFKKWQRDGLKDTEEKKKPQVCITLTVLSLFLVNHHTIQEDVRVTS